MLKLDRSARKVAILLMALLASVAFISTGCSQKKPETPSELPSTQPPSTSNPAAPRYKISGQVFNLTHGQISLRLNGNETKVVTAGSNQFEFDSLLLQDENYFVTISSPLQNPSLECLLTNASGQVSNSNVTNISVVCPRLQSLVISSPVYSLASATQLQLTATAIYSNGLNVNVTNFGVWQSSDPTRATLNSTGRLTTLSAGSVAAQFSFGGQSSLQNYNISSATLQSISISPLTLSLPINSQSQLIATGAYSDGSFANITQSVTWNSASESVATISSSGQVSSLTSGSSLITASLGGISANRNVTVTAATLSSIDVTPAFISSNVNNSRSLKVYARYSDSSVVDVTNQATLLSRDPGIASTAQNQVQLLSAGSTQVQVSFGQATFQVPVIVNAKTLQSLSLSENSLTLPPSVVKKLSLTAHFSDGSTEDVSSSASWVSSSPQVATVNTDGKISAISAGSTQLTAFIQGQQISANVVVANLSLTSLRITPGNLLIAKGVNVPFSMYGTFSDGIEYDVTLSTAWSSSNTSLAQISNSEGSQGYMNNLSTGAAYVNVTITGAFMSQSASATMTINPASLTSLILSPSSITVNPFKVVQMRVLGQFSDGGLSDLTSIATWSSGNSSIAAVSNFQKGSMTSLFVGSTTLMASVGLLNATREVVVSGTLPEAIALEGLGLTGEYFANRTLDPAGFRGKRIDSQVNYNWATGTAPLGVGDSFSIRFSGQVQVVYSENYTFCTRSDDGIRVFVNGLRIINNWTDHAVTENCGSISLIAGQKYNIVVEFYENGGYAVVELYWQSPSQAKGIVPRAFLFDSN